MRVLWKLCLSLLGAVGLLLAGEAAARLAGVAPPFLNLQPKIWRVPADHVASVAGRAGPKAPGTFRIAALGESTTLGWPLPQEFSYASLLAPILNGLHLPQRVEVVNLAHTAIHAEDVAGILEQSDPLDPDLYLVVTGQNEFANRLFWQPPPPLVHRLLASSHLLRWLLAPKEERLVPEAFLKTKHEDLISAEAAAVGRPMLDNLPVEGFERGLYRERYGRALRRMIAAAKRRGRPIVFGEPVVNLKDYAPYFPTRRARDAFDSGRETLQRGELAEARRLFELALDQDGGPLRMPGPLLDELRDVCTRENVPLVALRAAVDRASKDGIPGHEAILDNLHPNVLGHRTIALATARLLVERGLVPLAAEPPGEDRWSAVAAELAEIDLSEEKRREVAINNAVYLGAQYFAAGNLEASERRLRAAFDDLGARDFVTQQLLLKIYRSQGREDEIAKLAELIAVEARAAAGK